MRPIVLGAVLTLVGLAQSQNALPQCAQGCVNQFTSGSQIGTCGNLDVKCICSNQNFLSSIACCLAATCNTSDQQAAVAYAKQICTTAGVTVPDAVVCASSSTATPSTTSSTSSSTASVGSQTGTSPASSTSSAPVAATSSSALASSTAASASPSPAKNAGIQNTAGAGMCFAGGLAVMLALL